ncbi:MAG: tRNA 2-thiouridine(34) synthase MnmA [Dehalococcoidales bacterium]
MEAVKVVIAMSGGVDSSVAAARLKQAGYRVIGVTMQVWPAGNRFGGCCGIDAMEDAKRVAYQLDIPHYVMNFRDIFASKVIDDFCQEYRRGRTPNPCIRCNQHIKFDALLEKARGLGADFVATGHYARIEFKESTGRYLLKKGADRNKDQSYFLYTMTQGQLKAILFPVGDLTKQEVRKIAGELGLPVASKPESQEICFIPDNDYTEFIREYIPQAALPGPIFDEGGHNLGSHRGIMYYTIGQRKRLGLSAPKPQYVIAIQPEKNAIVVGPRERALGDQLTAAEMNWITDPETVTTLKIKAMIRYRHREAEASVNRLRGDNYYVKFTEPQMAITPGQAVVFYHEDEVVGGGTIETAVKEEKTGKEKEYA